MAEIAFRMLISLILKDPMNMESVMFCDLKNIMREGSLPPPPALVGQQAQIKDFD